MKVIDAPSELSIILKGSRLSKDTRIVDSFLLSRFNAYRSVEIRESYKRNQFMDPAVQQDMGLMMVTEVPSNDPLIGQISSKTPIGKIHIPSIVSLPSDKGIVSVHPPSRLASLASQYYGTPYNTFGSKATHKDYCNFNWYTRIQNHVYIHPYKSEIRMILINDDPMDGYVLQTETPAKDALIFSTDYTLGESYTVKSGQVVHNGITQATGTSFIAVNPNYTGNGVLKFTNQKRKMTLEDDYPISYTMTEVIMMKILQKDFGLEKQEIADIRNNATDDSLLLKQG